MSQCFISLFPFSVDPEISRQINQYRLCDGHGVCFLQPFFIPVCCFLEIFFRFGRQMGPRPQALIQMALRIAASRCMIFWEEYAMNGIYYFGDYVLLKSQSMIDMRYVFSGAQALGDGWFTVNFTVTTHTGYAGGGASIALTVRPGDTYRLGAGFAAYIDQGGGYGKKKRSAAAMMRFDAIAHDCLEASFEARY